MKDSPALAWNQSSDNILYYLWLVSHLALNAAIYAISSQV